MAGDDLAGDWQAADWSRAATSALDWWRDAGVDTLIDEAPRDWMARSTPPAAPALPPAAPVPRSLPEWLAWRTGAEAPDAGWPGRRIAPALVADAPLMVIADVPDAEDIAAGALLADASGRLLDRMLAAIGLARPAVAIASIALARPLGGVIPEGAAAALVDAARLMVALGRPARVLLLGQPSWRLLALDDGALARGRLHALNLGGGRMVPAVATLHPRFLREHPAAKAEAWKDLQLLIGESSV